MIVGEGSVLSMGVYLGQSTKIIDRATGDVHQGRVPPYSVVVSGTMPGKPLPDGTPGPSLYCAVIVKTRRRAHPRQDLDQRIAQGLMSGRSSMPGKGV